MNNKTIVLAGFMGTGKSTVAHSVARLLGRKHIDTDKLAVKRMKMSITRAFEAVGEPFFRVVEKGICYEMAVSSRLVVSSGGGALVDVQTRELLVKHCFVVCLTATPDTIAQRIEKDAERPLASQWQTRLLERQPMYDSLPYHVKTDDKTPEHIAQEIIALWQNS